MNLAPFKYRNLLGRIIDKVYSVEVKSPIIGDYFECTAYLVDKNRPDFVRNKVKRLYGYADGCGSARQRNIAVYKAISEALERWAFYESVDSDKKETLGFNIDSSTNGMAAYPGFTSFQARKNATFEARERWSLIHWWFGELGHRLIESHEQYCALQIETPWKACHVVLLWMLIPETNKRVYGFAASGNIQSAIRKALYEMDRNYFVIKKYLMRSAAGENLRDIQATNEKRLVFFSDDIGFEQFFKRVRTFSQRKTAIPKTVVDCEITGSWSQYARVWRVLYENAHYDYLSDKPDIFFF